MPNWNETKYVITGSKEEISKLHEIIKKPLSDENLKSGDFGNNWLGFIVNGLNENPNTISCRGWIENPKLTNKTTLKFTTYTAWNSCYELFELICKKFPTLEYYFISSEPLSQIYVTNDKDKKYFKYSKKYEIWDRDRINHMINVENQLSKMIGNHIPNDSIYIRVSAKK